MIYIYINNISNRLRELFFKGFEKKYEVPKREYGGIPYNPYLPSRTIVYFYEWSNPNSVPKCFYTMDGFDKFLQSSQIYLQGYQREIITNLGTVYISCKRGSTDLIIKSTYINLRNALEEEDKNKLNNKNPFHSTGDSLQPRTTHHGSEDNEPYRVAITRPKIKFEVENRYPDMEAVGDWFG